MADTVKLQLLRPLGVLWAHAPIEKINLSYDPDAVVRYMWGDRTLAFVSCGTCGCTTHWESADVHEHPRMAVNSNMSQSRALAEVRIRHCDGAERWHFPD